MNARRMARLLVLPICAAAVLSPAVVFGQEPERNVTVRERPRPDFDPRGIRAGGFLIYPSTSIEGEWNDNIFASDNDTIDDYIVRALPSVVVQSNFPRHNLRLSAFSDVGRYMDENSEDYWDYGGTASGRYDIQTNSRLTGRLAAARDHERRDDPEDTRTTRPVRFFAYDAQLGYEQLFNRFNFRVLGEFNRRDYRDAAPASTDENERDRNIYAGGLRTGYFISPRVNVFTQGRYFVQKRDTDETLANGQTRSRDSNGFEVAVGSEIDITGLLFGEVFAGFTRQYFDSSDFDTQNGFSYGLGMTWNPTGLTTVGVNGRGGFLPTDTGNASSRLQSLIDLRVDHELLRNLILGGGVGYIRDDFTGINRTDNRYQAGADVTYLINRNFSVSGGYSFTTRKSDDNTREFNRNLVTLRVTARL